MRNTQRFTLSVTVALFLANLWKTILSVVTIRNKALQHLLRSVGITIFVIRILTAITIYFIGETNLWHSIYFDNWNHYYLGILILLVVPFLKDRFGRTFVPSIGVGIGLIIDEVTDVLKVLGARFPANFRDSPYDLFLIFITFLLFVFLVKLTEVIIYQIVQNKNKEQDREKITQNAIIQFDAWAPHYDSGISHFFFDLCNNEILKILGLRTNSRILDVGCGTGNLLLEINKRQKGLNLYGVDLSQKMISIAKAKMANFKNVAFLTGNGNLLPFANDYFDAVICANSLHHHPNPNRSLLEMSRVLKRGGQLIIVDGFRNNILRAIMFQLVQLIAILRYPDKVIS